MKKERPFFKHSFKKPRYYDSQHNVVPKRLKDVFEAGERMKAQVDRLVAIVVGVHDYAFLYADLNISLPKIEQFILTTYMEIIQYLPYVVCRCGGSESCRHCGGKGWMNQREVSKTGLFSLQVPSEPEPDQTSTSP